MIKSYTPNLDNLRLSLSKLMQGRGSVKTPKIGGKFGKTRLRMKAPTSIKMNSSVKLPSAFPSHQFTGNILP